ncbi:type II secretion system protein GspL [Vibrio sonorensis]|uniref:type II secretion system protein GspL n=1 Tax=Vibrio sonorensis TaxID=1004316 RepID=UPI0008DA8ED2|nr:type II secretion system protein GspL [Vibrio sonorensis]
MNEYLIVRLSNRQDNACQWVAWSEGEQQVIGSGEIASVSDLSELSAYSSGRQTVVLLNSADLFLSRVEIPVGSQRQFENMLPYIVEDDIAQDVEALHFTVLKKQGGFADVCAVEHAWLERVQASFSQVGIEVSRVMPDIIALPSLNERISAVEIAGEWLVKKSENTGLVVAKEWLPMIAQSDWVKQDEIFLPLTAYTPLPSIELAEEQEWQQGEPILVMELLAMGAVKNKVNLLTGRYKAKSSAAKHWTVWRSAIAAGTLFLAVLLTHQWMQIRTFEQQAESYRAESERIFRTVLVGKQRIPTVSYLKREMQREESRLSGNSGETSMLTWLSDLPSALNKAPALNLTNLTYDANRGEVRLQAQSKDFDTFNKAKNALEANFVVQQGQLNRSGELVNGSFVLKRKGVEENQ